MKFRVGVLPMILSSLCLHLSGLDVAQRFLLEFLYLALICCCAILLWVARRYVTRPVGQTFLFFGLTICTLPLVADSSQLRPTLFFLAMTGMCCYVSSMRPSLDAKIVRVLIWIYLILISASLFFSVAYINDRFVSFVGSPTVLSVVLLVVFAIYAAVARSRTMIIVGYFAIGFLIFLTQTRLSIVLWLITPGVVLFSGFSIRRKVIIYVTMLVGLIAGYPIFEYVGSVDQGGYVTREVGAQGEDASFGLRRALTNQIFDEFQSSSMVSKVIGNGSEAARDVIKLNFGTDLLPHNDYLRIAFDFGILFLLMYIFCLFKLVVGSRDFSVNYIFIIYLVSFYHNMVYFLLCPLALLSLLFCTRSDMGRN
ncbi:O-antigen ligase family protein [Cupriavidus sp. AcVe19-6a]|uniref:O-antigen ligase family protein n=1 Tax=Cupriavidus sp. AcVe19-6a TaxID=2821358 RepID=UPI001AE1DA1A|nr:O-antigen ligase family protein [Cupriavidus sp. AcVe19-6a]MBP0640058.1 O-antigen ligase family protein [Cupriavidus sp. AcVe19-6a]